MHGVSSHTTTADHEPPLVVALTPPLAAAVDCRSSAACQEHEGQEVLRARRGIASVWFSHCDRAVPFSSATAKEVLLGELRVPGFSLDLRLGADPTLCMLGNKLRVPECTCLRRQWEWAGGSRTPMRQTRTGPPEHRSGRYVVGW